MDLTDDQKQYFYGEIQRVFPDEENLKIIFIDNEGKFGENVYNHIRGNTYRNRLTFITQRLQEKKLLDLFIKVVQKQFSNFVQEIVTYNRVTERVTQLESDLDHLKNLLEQKKWIEADIETTNLLLKSIGHQNSVQNSVRKKIFKKIDCDLLRGIDQLWQKESDGKFGFSAQKEIWKDVKKDFSSSEKEDHIEIFGYRVSWYNREEEEWLKRPERYKTPDVIFQEKVNDKTKGFLPTLPPSNYYRKKIQADLISYFMKKLESCEFLELN